MVMDFYILIYIIAIYFIGFCIAVYVLRNELGKETEDIMGNVYSKTYMDICLKAMCWPLLILLIILFGPFMIVSQLILNLNKK
jgi:hypothetical protein